MMNNMKYTKIDKPWHNKEWLEKELETKSMNQVAREQKETTRTR